VCAISYYLERAGIMTTGISLVRENAQSMQPPRSLWVSFPLGRPLGVPDDVAFQHRVITAALTLLERGQGPVLEDFPEDAPEVQLETAPACPVSFSKATDHSTWQGRLATELAALEPWYELGRRRRAGRSLVGVSESSIDTILEQLGEFLDAEQLPTDDLHWFKHAIEDAKTYYVEALTAQPGVYVQRKVYDTLWHETQLGAGLAIFYEGFRAHPKLHLFARIVLPREAVGRSRGDEVIIKSENTSP
jgi:D-proline reductase (dithiol) PrdB